MPYLTFYRDRRAVMRYELKGENITIGRDPSCDIQLIEDDISRIHCSITWENGTYLLTDTSTNGTFVNDERIQTRSLQSNDSIKISDWRLAFEKSASEGGQKTVVRDTSPTKVLKFEAKKKELLIESLTLTVKTADGKSKEYNASNAAIGSAPSNDIIITNDPYISSTHCLIRTEDDNYILEDRNSKNGTFLNNKKITTEALPRGGEIKIGKTSIKFAVKQSSEKLKASPTTSLGPIIGKSNSMRELFTLLTRIAPSDVTVCLIGESGTGKELAARYIHEASSRRTRPFVAVNCGAIPANLIESELFGHERGAFTSATSQHKGVFEQADGGTLFLDEISEMPADLQTRLLRVLETKEVKKVGGQSDIPVNTRLIAATNKDLKALVSSGRFREDLFYRLFVIPITIPPLRERKEDISLLADHFLSSLAPAGTGRHMNDAALNKLFSYDWPGNVRELKNVIQRALLVSEGHQLTKDDIIFDVAQTEEHRAAMEEQKRNSVLLTLKSANGNISEAARRLKVSRTTLASMVRRFKIDVDEIKIRR